MKFYFEPKKNKMIYFILLIIFFLKTNLYSEEITGYVNVRDGDTIKIKGNKQIVDQINKNSTIQIITRNKTHQDILILLGELIKDHKDQNNLKKIESLEQKLINNLDENSYSELIKLKSQINRD